MDLLDFQPSVKPQDTQYHHLVWKYDNGLVVTCIAAGSVFNNAFQQPYLLPSRVYIVMHGQIHLMPEIGS